MGIVCVAVLNAQLCDSITKRKDGVSLSGAVKGLSDTSVVLQRFKEDNMRRGDQKTDRIRHSDEAASQWWPSQTAPNWSEMPLLPPRDKVSAEPCKSDYRYYYSRIFVATTSFPMMNSQKAGRVERHFPTKDRKKQEHTVAEKQITKERNDHISPFAAKALPLEVYQGDNHQLHISLRF